jgi:uncharacterized protein (TIGR00369 family)
MHEQVEHRWMEEGFQLWPSVGPFLASAGSFYFKEISGGMAFRLRLKQAHCNAMGLVHGGLLATLADSWLAISLARGLPPGTKFVTSSLGIDYLASCAPGQVLELEIDRLRRGRRMCFACGALLASNKAIAAVRVNFVLL